MSRYYTPTVEEFHVLFKFEKHDGISWIRCDGNRKEVWEVIEGWFEEDPKWYRVKYLDRKDIEELGWEYDSTEDGIEKYFMLITGNEGGIPGIYQLTFSAENKTVRILHKLGITDFEVLIGMIQIKNYNELKTLQKQLGI